MHGDEVECDGGGVRHVEAVDRSGGCDPGEAIAGLGGEFAKTLALRSENQCDGTATPRAPVESRPTIE